MPLADTHEATFVCFHTGVTSSHLESESVSCERIPTECRSVAVVHRVHVHCTGSRSRATIKTERARHSDTFGQRLGATLLVGLL